MKRIAVALFAVACQGGSPALSTLSADLSAGSGEPANKSVPISLECELAETTESITCQLLDLSELPVRFALRGYLVEASWDDGPMESAAITEDESVSERHSFSLLVPDSQKSTATITIRNRFDALAPVLATVIDLKDDDS